MLRINLSGLKEGLIMSYRIERGLLAALNILKSRGIDAQKVELWGSGSYRPITEQRPLGLVDVLVELSLEEWRRLELAPNETEEDKEETVEILYRNVYSLHYKRTIKAHKLPAVVIVFRAYGAYSSTDTEEE